MKFAFALHQIIRQKEAVEPGSVFPVSDETEFAELLQLGAIREATAAELALFQMTEPQSEPIVQLIAVSTERDALEARAKELGVDFSPRIGDAKLAERIEEAELGKSLV